MFLLQFSGNWYWRTNLKFSQQLFNFPKSTLTIETLEKGVKYNQSYNEDTKTTPVTWSCFFILNLNLNFELWTWTLNNIKLSESRLYIYIHIFFFFRDERNEYCLKQSQKNKLKAPAGEAKTNLNYSERTA